MRAWVPPLMLALALAFAPSVASAVTVEEIVTLSKAGISEAVILALIDRDRTVFGIEPAQLVALKRDGLSDAIIMALLKSGREEGDDAARVVSDANAAAILSTLSPVPELTIIGHGPDRPNTPYREFAPYRPPFAIPVPVPYVDPYADPYAALYDGSRATHRFKQNRERTLCLAQVRTGAAVTSAALSYVTECPAVMQRPPRRSSR